MSFIHYFIFIHHLFPAQNFLNFLIIITSIFVGLLGMPGVIAIILIKLLF